MTAICPENRIYWQKAPNLQLELAIPYETLPGCAVAQRKCYITYGSRTSTDRELTHLANCYSKILSTRITFYTDTTNVQTQ
jgi:hypothetical protein